MSEILDRPLCWDSRLLTRLHRERFVENTSKVTIEETEEKGKGVIRFRVSTPCLAIRLPQQPVRWLVEQKCADGLVFQATEGGIRLHLVELKGKVSASNWDDIERQFHGAYLNAIAIGSLIGLSTFHEIIPHLACKDDDKRMATLKTGVGERQPAATENYARKQIDIGRLKVPVKFVQRDASGNANVTL